MSSLCHIHTEWDQIKIPILEIEKLCHTIQFIAEQYFDFFLFNLFHYTMCKMKQPIEWSVFSNTPQLQQKQNPHSILTTLM